MKFLLVTSVTLKLIPSNFLPTSRVLTFLASLISLITAVVIKCDEFRTSVWWHPNQTYECEDMVMNILTESDRYVINAEGRHKNGYSFQDVQSLWVHKGIIKYFPRKIQSLFPNLIGLSFMDTNITEIHREDLESFPKLIRLNLADNSISVLESDLFVHNTNLKIVGFNNNKITHVDSHVFMPLNNLISLHFVGNTCYSGEAKDNRLKVLFLIWNIQMECFDMRYSLKKIN